MAGCPVHGGLPVPAIVATLKGHIDLAPSTWAGSTHMTRWVPEGDAPDFGKYDEEQLRRCIHDRWCHVCTRPVESPMICLPKHNNTWDGQHIEYAGRWVPLVIQPWVCAECLKFATKYCPPLRKAIDERRGLVAYIDEARLVATQWQPAGPEDPVPPEGAKVLSFLKLALVRARYMPLPEWVRRFA